MLVLRQAYISNYSTARVQIASFLHARNLRRQYPGRSMDLDEFPCPINPFQNASHPHDKLFDWVSLPPKPPDLSCIEPRRLVPRLHIKVEKGDAEILGAGDMVLIIRCDFRAACENLAGIRSDFHIVRNGMHERDEVFSISGDERVKIRRHRIMRSLHGECR